MRRFASGALVCAAALGCPAEPPRERSERVAPVVAPAPRDDGAPMRARLREAVAAKGPGYLPRTRHLADDGSPRYVNRLILEASPYLLQHAHNPVDWFAWGPDALARARDTGRPIFLSIGYSTCHWCHVMEEESFEDEEIAAVLNERYVAIKVDREERPDLDAVYMTFVQTKLTGRGGWPMSVWLTPDGEPFFGGTYFPPRAGVRGARAGFIDVLREQADRLVGDPDGVRAEARRGAGAIRAVMLAEPPTDVAQDAVLATLLGAVRGASVTAAVLVVGSATDLAGPLGAALPPARDKPLRAGRATAYVCEEGACALPTSDPRVLAAQLRRGPAEP